jgi:chorismate mutase
VSGVRAIRGAVQASENSRAAIEAATRELLSEMARRNDLTADDLLAVWFTQTPDLTAAHAAAAARALGWTSVPLLSAQEVPVADQLPRVIRALVLAEREGDRRDVRHAYLGGTSVLREDLS